MSAPCPTLLLRVQDASEVGTARRNAVAATERLGFSEERRGQLALIVTELATNLVRHGQGGEMLVRILPEPDPGVEIVAVDSGPGMGDVARALGDGYSTGGTRGAGLGAVARIADACELFSTPGAGTAAVARLFLRPGARPGGPRVAGLSLPIPGEEVCGDAWSWRPEPDGWTAMVVDGLGHGAAAADAAVAAIASFEASNGASPTEILQRAHGALRHTRGAAVGVAHVSTATRTLTFAGVGNVGGSVLAGGAGRNVISHPGIVGQEMRKVQEFQYPWPAGAVLVLHSDGLQSRWSLERYPSLAGRDPALLAAVLRRDFARPRDDVTVVAGREGDAP